MHGKFDLKLMAEGKWTIKDKKLKLLSQEYTAKIPYVWTNSDHGKAGKAIHGFCFYRLRKIDKHKNGCKSNSTHAVFRDVCIANV